MRILIDILHPAHVHFFRNFHGEMADRGPRAAASRPGTRTARSSSSSSTACRTSRSRLQRAGASGMVTEMSQRTGAAPQGDAAVPARRDDRDHGPVDRSRRRASGGSRRSSSTTPSSPRQTNWFVYPLAHSVCTPDCYQGKVRGQPRHLRRLPRARLPPSRPLPFPTPSGWPRSASGRRRAVLVVRFVSWQAVHDRKEKGLTAGQKRDAGRDAAAARARAPLLRVAPCRRTSPPLRAHRARSRTSTTSWPTRS